jgi:hypothetical protein
MEKIINEISISQRMDRKRNMRLMQPKLQRTKKIALNKKATQKTLEKRAQKRAINIVYKRIAKQSKIDIPISRKPDIEKKIIKKKSMIQRIAKRLKRFVSIDDIRRQYRK